MAATVAQSRARTPGTSSTGQEMTMALLVWVFVAEEWIEKVQRVSDRIILVKLIDGQSVVTPFCMCMPHRVQAVALEWAATASSAMAASTGCTRNAVGSSA